MVRMNDNGPVRDSVTDPPARSPATVPVDAPQVRAASGINVLLGAWLIASPWIYGYTGLPGAFWNSIVVGALILIFAAGRFSTPMAGASWANVLLGLWTIASPWIFGYTGNSSAFWNSIILGILVTILAGWSGYARAPTRAADTPIA